MTDYDTTRDRVANLGSEPDLIRDRDMAGDLSPTESMRRESERMDSERLVTGLFPDRESAERAYRSVSDMGYTDREISLVMSDDTRRVHFGSDEVTTELGTKAAEGAGIGGAIGGVAGAIAAAVAAIGTTLVLPGLGIAIAGPIAAAVAGAGAGGATGGLIGALIGWGIPEERVQHYESGIREGGILLGVRPRTAADAELLERQWRQQNGQHVYS